MLAGPAVVGDTMAAYRASTADLPERLMQALEAGQQAGGDRRGRQSAAMVLTTTEDFPDLNLRGRRPSRSVGRICGAYWAYGAARVPPRLKTAPSRSQPSGVTDLDAIEGRVAGPRVEFVVQSMNRKQRRVESKQGDGSLVRATQCFDQAVQHHQAGRLTEAVALYRQAIGFKPDFTNAFYNQGLALQLLGRVDESGRLLHQGGPVQSGIDGTPITIWVSPHTGRGRDEEAAAHFRHVIEMKPDQADAHYNLGITFALTGQAGRSHRQLSPGCRGEAPTSPTRTTIWAFCSLKRAARAKPPPAISAPST